MRVRILSHSQPSGIELSAAVGVSHRAFTVELLASALALGGTHAGEGVLAFGAAGSAAPLLRVLSDPTCFQQLDKQQPAHADVDALFNSLYHQLQLSRGAEEDVILLNYHSLPALREASLPVLEKLLYATPALKSLRIVQVDGLNASSYEVAPASAAAAPSGTAVTAAAAWLRQLMRRVKQHHDSQAAAAAGAGSPGDAATSPSSMQASMVPVEVTVVRADFSSVSLAAKEVASALVPQQDIQVTFEGNNSSDASSSKLACQVPLAMAWERPESISKDGGSSSMVDSLLPLGFTARGLLSVADLGLECLAGPPVKITAKNKALSCMDRQDGCGVGDEEAGATDQWSGMLQELLRSDNALLLQAGEGYPATFKRGRWYALLPVAGQTTAALLYRLQTRESLSVEPGSAAALLSSTACSALGMDVNAASSSSGSEAFPTLCFLLGGSNRVGDGLDQYRVRYHPLLFTDGLLDSLYKSLHYSNHSATTAATSADGQKKAGAGRGAVDGDGLSGPLVLLHQGMANALPEACRGEAWSGSALGGGTADTASIDIDSASAGDDSVVMRSLEEELGISLQQGGARVQRGKGSAASGKEAWQAGGNSQFDTASAKALLKGFFGDSSAKLKSTTATAAAAPISLANDLTPVAAAPAGRPTRAAAAAAAQAIASAGAAGGSTTKRPQAAEKAAPAPPATVTATTNTRGKSAVAAPPVFAAVPPSASPQANLGKQANKNQQAPPVLPTQAQAPVTDEQPSSSSIAAPGSGVDPSLMSWDDLVNQGLETVATVVPPSFAAGTAASTSSSLAGVGVQVMVPGSKVGAIPSPQPPMGQQRDPRRAAMQPQQSPQPKLQQQQQQPTAAQQPQAAPLKAIGNRLDRVLPVPAPSTAATVVGYVPPPPPPAANAKKAGPVVRSQRSASASSSSDSSDGASFNNGKRKLAPAAAATKIVQPPSKALAHADLDSSDDDDESTSIDSGSDSDDGGSRNGRGGAAGGAKKLIKRASTAATTTATRGGRGRGRGRGGAATSSGRTNAAAAPIPPPRAPQVPAPVAQRRKVGVILDDDDDEDFVDDIVEVSQARAPAPAPAPAPVPVRQVPAAPRSTTTAAPLAKPTAAAPAPASLPAPSPLLAALADDLELAAELGLQPSSFNAAGHTGTDAGSAGRSLQQSGANSSSFGPVMDEELLSLLSVGDENRSGGSAPSSNVTALKPILPAHPSTANSGPVIRPGTASSILGGSTNNAPLPSLMEAMGLKPGAINTTAHDAAIVTGSDMGSNASSGSSTHQHGRRVFKPTAADIAMLQGHGIGGHVGPAGASKPITGPITAARAAGGAAGGAAAGPADTSGYDFDFDDL